MGHSELIISDKKYHEGYFLGAQIFYSQPYAQQYDKIIGEGTE